MTKLKTEKFISELNSKWNGKVCPFCGGKWIVSEKIFELREFNGGDVVLGGPIQPVVAVTCENCGNTVLVNPLVIKAVEE